jgi:1,2-phenylacetyl-CoA epoxidase catalytic subunit
MLTKQSRQFEQWADDKDRLAKIAAEKQAKTKKNSASLLMKLGVTVVAIACYGFLYNQDTDWAVVLVFGFAVTVYGVVNLKD